MLEHGVGVPVQPPPQLQPNWLLQVVELVMLEHGVGVPVQYPVLEL